MFTVECWTQINDVHGFGGVSQNVTTLEECQATCISDNICVAIDWEPSNVERSCWILEITDTDVTTETGVITHYELHRPCPR